jgi:ubiquitin-protein ligase
MAKSKIHKQLNAEIDELKLLGTNHDVPIVFILDETSINKEERFDVEEANERVIIGRIFPNSDIFKEGAFQIEIKLPPAYPFDPPKVRFLTPIYHPNVDKEGKHNQTFL